MSFVFFFFSSRRRHTRCALVTGVQTCALPIYRNSRAAERRFTLEFFENTSVNLVPFLPWGSPGGIRKAMARKMTASTAAIPVTDALNPMTPSSAAPSKKPQPLTAFFEPVRTATHRKSAPSSSAGASTLTALFELLLARSFATTEPPWTTMTKTTERSEEHTSELQSLMRISYAVFCLKKKKQLTKTQSKIRELMTYEQQRTYQQTHTQRNAVESYTIQDY